MSQEPDPKVITYFRPGQLIFHLNGNLHDNPEEEIKALIDWAGKSEFAQSQKITFSPLSVRDSVLNFDPKPNSVVTQQKEWQAHEGLSYKSPPAILPGRFSLVGLDIKSGKWPLPPSPSKQDQEDALDELLELSISLNKDRSKFLIDPDRDLSLAAVSPNWLMSGGSQPGATGGPGGRPSPYNGSDNATKFDLEFLQAIPDESLRGELDGNVVVAILDTAPELRDDENEETVLKRIHDEWATKKGHWLIDSLLGKNRKLKKVYYDANVDKPIPGVWPNGHIEIEDHEYEMRDHGLFVAGIIHSIAPQADLYLFQVLNSYGVGDFLSIARALKKIHDDYRMFPKHRLVVNLSLTINIPIEETHGKKDKKSHKIRDKILQLKADGTVDDKGAVQTIEWICDSLYTQGAKVIAAAGNNGESNHRPQACYPAAFERVLGVGALPIGAKPANSQEKVKTAKYSNRSDRPDWSGIATLGGEEGDNSGVLGIYVEDFPKDANGNRKSNDSGWAWWAGTSFATPIISGMTAAVRSVMPTGKRVEEAVVELLRAQPYKTEIYDEDVLWVKQGT